MLGSSERWGLNSAHFHGTQVPVEEPSTASKAEALNHPQTQRIAFLAEYSGQWLIEATGIEWASPKLVRFYSVA